MGSRRRQRVQEPPSQRNGNGLPARLRAGVPPAVPVTDTTRIRVIPEPEATLPPPPLGSGGGEPDAGNGRGSRFNRLADGLRSRLLFPDQMKRDIDQRAGALIAERKPKTTFEAWCLGEMAIATTQIDVANDQKLINDMRIIERVDLYWSDDRRDAATRLAANLSKQPHLAAPALESTKHGALLMITRLQFLAEAVETNGGLDEDQRDALFDLLAIDKVFRNGVRRVPAGDDGPGLTQLLNREMARHRDNLKRTLETRDDADRRMAGVGIHKTQDAETKRLRSDELRARRRLAWAQKTYNDLQMGVSPSAIVDPATGKPIDPQPYTGAAPKGAPAAPATSPSPPPPAEDPPSPATEGLLPPLPEGCPDELREALLIAGAMIREQQARPDGAAPLDTPPDDPA